ncbi:uncharacterized protein LOC105201998 isoform X1 [Solenopsis invicta]|nr:uncharacterized protein LOC105201998 isoform X1 [Solenopsis invicta]
MTTPVLTKKQQRHSLSAKKKGPTKLKNVLAQPYPNFWPVISVDQYPELVANLNMILPSIKPFNSRLPKHVLKDIPKKDRALARKEMLEKAPPKPDILKFMIIGVNVITRALEKNNVCCVLLDSNVEPPLIIKHVVTMAVNKKIPVLLLPILKAVTLEKMGFATAAFALKQEVLKCPDNICHPLYKSIAEAFKDFELPQCLLQHCKPDEMPDESSMCEIKIRSKKRDKNPNIFKPEKPVIVFTDVYKYRSSRDKRAFIPPAVNPNSQISQTSSDDFIAFGSDFDLANDYCADIPKNKRYVNIGKEEKHEARKIENTENNQSSKNLKLINDSADSTKHAKNYILKRKDESNYLSLKIKRIQANNKRHKATKFTKKK